MTGETDLRKLIASMAPELSPGIYIFATLPPGVAVPAQATEILRFVEAEGLTLVLLEDRALCLDLAGVSRSRRITLTVHSSLDAVGFLAAVLPPLARAGIPVNVVSAFHHDHLFVPVDRAEEAMAILSGLAETARMGDLAAGTPDL